MTLDAVKRHGGVAHRGLVGADLNFKQGLNDFEQAGQYFGGGEVLFDFLFAEAVAGLFQFFRNIGHIPRVERTVEAQFLAGKCAQIGQVFFGKWSGFGGQIAQKRDDFLGRFGHFGHHRDLRVIVKTQQARFFLAQRQDFLNQGRVVQMPGVFGRLVRGTRDMRFVELLTQSAAVCKLHNRQVNGHFEGQSASLFAFFFCRLAGRLHHVFGHAFQLVLADIQGKAVGGIERVFAEFLRHLGQAFLDGGVAGFGLAL